MPGGRRCERGRLRERAFCGIVAQCFQSCVFPHAPSAQEAIRMGTSQQGREQQEACGPVDDTGAQRRRNGCGRCAKPRMGKRSDSTRRASSDVDALPQVHDGWVFRIAWDSGLRRRRRDRGGHRLDRTAGRGGDRSGKGREPRRTHPPQLWLPSAGGVSQKPACDAPCRAFRPARSVPGGHAGSVLRQGG